MTSVNERKWSCQRSLKKLEQLTLKLLKDRVFHSVGWLGLVFCIFNKCQLEVSCYSSPVSDAIQMQKEWSFAKTHHLLTDLYCRVSVGLANSVVGFQV